MGAVYSILIILTCIILVLAILVQNPKGGGLASGFTAGSQVMGVRRTADFLEKATWGLVVFLFILSVASTAYTGNGKAVANAETSATKDKAGQFDKTNKNAPQQQPNTFGAPRTAPSGNTAPKKPN